jgi:hypothetical protein
MSQENTYLVILAILLCSLNIFMGPLAFHIANLFARFSPSVPELGEADETERASVLLDTDPSRVHSRSGQYLRAGSTADDNAQMSKYR